MSVVHAARPSRPAGRTIDRSMLKVSMALWVLLVVAVPALGDQAGELPPRSGFDRPAASAVPVAGAVSRVGGDGIADAVAIPGLPFTDTGNTCGYADDLDAQCPSVASAPDVVYSLELPTSTMLDIDLCGSLYDSKVYVLDADLQVVACSDDYYWWWDDPCGQWNSRVEAVSIAGGATYYVVVDGYGTSCGDYELAVREYEPPCPVTCPPDAIAEGEPPLVDGYEDRYNGGCFADWDDPLTYVMRPHELGSSLFCGRSGYWWNNPSGWPDQPSFDIDWFEVFPASPDVMVTITVEAQFQARVAEITLGPAGCDDGWIHQEVEVMPCTPTTITALNSNPNRAIYWQITPRQRTTSVTEWDWVVEFANIQGGSVAIEAASWSSIKALFH